MSNKEPILIVMLTYHDRTVKNADEIFEKCKNSNASFWGMKEEGLPLNEMKMLFSKMKAYGKTTVLEVVAYTEKECLEGAKTAYECECDILMGTMFYESVNNFCNLHNIKYMPFVGKVEGRPSVLSGSITDAISEAEMLKSKGVFGFDLLGYRYTDDSEKLIRDFSSSVKSHICIAGSVDSFEKLDSIIKYKPWAFTVGSAFFDNKFGQEFNEQIKNVLDYIKNHI